MTYLAVMAVLCTAPLVFGRFLARRSGVHAGSPPAKLRTWIGAFGGAAVWWGVSWLARWYGDTDWAGWGVAEWWAHSGKWFAFCALVLGCLGWAIGIEEQRSGRWHKILCGVGILMVVWITVWRTMPIYAFLQAGNMRDANALARQTMDYTCGPVCLVNASERMERVSGWTEREAARLCGTTWEGTTTTGLIRGARRMGIPVSACRRMSVAELEKGRRPAIVSISTVPGYRHATLLFGFGRGLVWFIDPDRGLWGVSKTRLESILVGKAIVLDTLHDTANVRLDPCPPTQPRKP